MPPAAAVLTASTNGFDVLEDGKAEAAFSTVMMKSMDVQSFDTTTEMMDASSTAATTGAVSGIIGTSEMTGVDNNNNKACDNSFMSVDSRDSTSMTCQESISSVISIYKSVRFPEKRAVQVIETISVADYTLEEMKATWYSKPEMRAFKQERRELARLVDQGITPDEVMFGTGNDVRGVESATAKGSQIRHKHIEDGIDSVMEEQDLQYEDCKWNANSIAYICHVACEGSVREAHKRGLLDEKEILEDLQRIRQDYVDLR